MFQPPTGIRHAARAADLPPTIAMGDRFVADVKRWLEAVDSTTAIR